MLTLFGQEDVWLGKKLTLHSSSLIWRQKIEYQEKVERDVSSQKRQITGKNPDSKVPKII